MGFFNVAASFLPNLESMKSIFSVIAKELGKALSVVIKVVAKTFEVIAKELDIIEENDDVEEIGDKALQAEEKDILPDKFDSYEEYLKNVKELELDPELSEKKSREEKELAFINVINLGLEDKFDTKIDHKFLGEIARDDKYFTPERVTETVKEFSESDLEVGKISDYFESKLGVDERDKMENSFVNVEKKLDPDKTEDQIFDTLDSMKR